MEFPTFVAADLSELAFILAMVREVLRQHPFATLCSTGHQTVLAVFFNVNMNILGTNRTLAARERTWHKALHTFNHIMHLHITGSHSFPTAICTRDCASSTFILEVLLES
jgi:hypothetical protein